LARPFYNGATRLLPGLGLKRLPGRGERIPYVYLACMASEDDDVDVFRHLLREALSCLRQGPWHYAIGGLHECDPRVPVMTALPHIRAAGRLFVVHYPEMPLLIDTVGQRVPYIEAGCL
jgi:hypothetical protein